jgi:hypothetical protein
VSVPSFDVWETAFPRDSSVARACSSSIRRPDALELSTATASGACMFGRSRFQLGEEHLDCADRLRGVECAHSRQVAKRRLEPVELREVVVDEPGDRLAQAVWVEAAVLDRRDEQVGRDPLQVG